MKALQLIMTEFELLGLLLSKSKTMKQCLLFITLSSLERLEKYHLPCKVAVELNRILCKSTWHITGAQSMVAIVHQRSKTGK